MGISKSNINITKLIIILIMAVFIAGCSIYKDRDSVEVTGMLEDASAVSLMLSEKPVIELPRRFFYPGEFFTVAVSKLSDYDRVFISTPLASRTPVMYDYKDKKICFIGIDYRTQVRDFPLKIQVMRNNIIVSELNASIGIMKKDFEKQYLQVTEEQKELRTNDSKLKEDAEHVIAAKSATHPEPQWDGSFIKPNDGRLSTGFGVIRYINDQENGRHSGLDIAAPTGTKVKAANSGRVKLGMMLNITGNTVIIDHGANIFSAYAHLDRILVKSGQYVKKGEIIGEVGSTGFSTGPHLHWTISVGSVYVDPNLFMERDPLELIE
ncbi:MAG: M23 family metallopeptidase [Bacillota bacterium]